MLVSVVQQSRNIGIILDVHLVIIILRIIQLDTNKEIIGIKAVIQTFPIINKLLRNKKNNIKYANRNK